MARRINVLTKHRLEKVESEMKEIYENSKLNKINAWNLQQAIDSVGLILEDPTAKKTTDG